MYNGCPVIALCISRCNDERSFELIDILHKAILSYGGHLLVFQTCSDLYWNTRNENGETFVFDLMDYELIDAVIIVEEAFRTKSIIQTICKNAEKHHTPVIALGDIKEAQIRFKFDYETGFEQVVRHIVEGHHISDIYFIAGRKHDPFSDRRIEVYKKVLLENNISFDETKLGYGDYWEMPTRAIINQLVEAGKLPQAIICANDTMAITSCAALQEHGFTIPQDILITGFDGIPEAKYCIPSITTCKCNYTKMTSDLLDALTHLQKDPSYTKQYVISYELDLDQSCGCKDSKSHLNAGSLLKEVQDRFHKYQDDERTLTEISSCIPSCETPEAFSTTLNDFSFENTCIMLNADCLNETLNPTISHSNKSYDENMYVMYQSSYEKDCHYPLAFQRKEPIPHFGDVLGKKNPLIFSALNFLDISLGYICFYFDVTMKQYCKIPQYTTAVSNFISSYRNMHYQQYIMHCIEESYKQDFLTGLYNRDGFYKELDKLLLQTKKNPSYRMLVASVDLNGLKYINDTFGHTEGDYAIHATATALRNCTLPNKIGGRFGGDELVLCTLLSDEDYTEMKLHQNILENLNAINQDSGKPYEISASIGICIAEPGMYDFDFLLKQSDQKMYLEKLSCPRNRRR